MNYDVIVCGAGPAGGSCARELSKKGLKVLLLEKSLEIGEPNFSTAGTPPETIKDFDLPKEIIFSDWNSLLISGPTERTEFTFDNKIGYTMRFRELKQFLVKDAIKNGAETRVNANVTKAIIKDDKIVGVDFNGVYGREEAYAKIIVDSTGARSFLASQLGLRKNMIEGYSPAVEYYMTNLDLERDSKRIDIYIGSKFKGGYAWIFPTGKNEAKVGLGWIASLHSQEKKNIIHELNDFIKENNQLKNGNFIELHSHFLFANPGLKKHTMNGFIAIGDAATQVNPLAGEGIRHCLWSGRIASDVIDKTLKNKGKLSDYDNGWKKYTKNKWPLCLRISKYLGSLDDKSLDLFLSKLKKVDKEDVLNMLFHYKFYLGLKYIKYAPGIFSKVLTKEVLKEFGRK